VPGRVRIPQPRRTAGIRRRPRFCSIHGSPGHKQDFDRLGPLLAIHGRVIAPDLPGFGASTHDIPDYSFRAHARYLLALMDRLAIRRAHVVGYSMGGGVALNMIDIEQGRVASLTMLSAIGVQEMELTGSYYLNHLVHGVQLGGLLALREATPHMGALDGAMLDVPYARNFYDSDQRPLREVLQRVDVPTLVLHGDRDPLVPVEAAREHHRLIPQSELVVLPSNHFMPFAQPELLAAPLVDFLSRVDSGRGVTRADASAVAVQDAARPFTASLLPRLRGIAAFVTTAVVAGLLLVWPDFGAVAIGVLLGEGRFSVLAAMVAMLLGLLLRQAVTGGFAALRRLLSSPTREGAEAALPHVRARRSGPMARLAWMLTLVAATAVATNWWVS
jgi:triacylglycerol lipase